MMRILTGVGLAVALAFTVAGGVPTADAAKKPTHNLCKAKDNAGKNISWKCGLEEKCCWQPFTNKAACVAKTGICL
jgi:hypothetical protein